MRQIIDQWLFNTDYYLIVADLGKFPKMETTKRYINVGLSETLLVNTALGLALTGKHVYIYSVAGFVLYRALEQLKLNINNTTTYGNKKIHITFLNGGAGFLYKNTGNGHFLLDDIVLVTKILPNFNIYIPYDEYTTIQCLNKSHTALNYIRLCPDDSIKKCELISTPNQLTILTFGWLVNKINNLNLNINIYPIVNFYLDIKRVKNKYIAIYDNINISCISNTINCIKTLNINNKYCDDIFSNSRQEILTHYGLSDTQLISFIMS